MFKYLLILLCFSCEKKLVEKEMLRPVKTTTVKISDGFEKFVFPGLSQSPYGSNLSFRVSGKIESIPVQVGDVVRKGQVLAKLDNSDYVLSLQQARAQVDQIGAQYINAKSNYERIQSLYESESASRNELDQAMFERDASKAQLDQARKQLELAKKNLSYTVLKSPRNNCTISAIPINENEVINVGTQVVAITCGNILEVVVAIPEGIISKVTFNDIAKVKFQAVDDMIFDAKVTEISNDATANNIFPVTLRLLRPNKKLRYGMAVEVSFSFFTESDKGLMMIPTYAVLGDTKGQYVYVYQNQTKGAGIVKKKSVEVGKFRGENIQILSGLESGDRVIVAGVHNISEGQKVLLYKGKQF